MTDETPNKIIIDDEEGKVTELDVIEQDDEGDAPPAPREITYVRPSDEDWLLDNLIGMANMGLEMGITLTVGGGLVSGTVIGGAAWIKLFAAQVREGLSRGNMSELAEQVAASLNEYEEVYAGKKKTLSPQAMFIHLKNARHFVGSAPIPNGEGVLWRGRLSEIAGFSLGFLEATQD